MTNLPYAFQSLLTEFGFPSIEEADAANDEAFFVVAERVVQWWEGLGPGKDVLHGDNLDLSDNLWQAGYLSEWPSMHTLLKANPTGSGFIETMRLIALLYNRAFEERSNPGWNAGPATDPGPMMEYAERVDEEHATAERH